MLISAARHRDIPALLELAESVRDSFPDYDEADCSRTFRRNIRRGSVLCIRSGATIAAALIYSPSHTAIGYLAVRHTIRRQGLGTALMRAAMESLGHTRPIYLHALRKNDEPGGSLHSFYTSLGFTPAQEETIEGIPYRRWIRRPQAMDAEHT